MQLYEVKISGMTCASCERIITKYVSKLDDVTLLSISSAKGRMLIKTEGDKRAEIEKAVEDAGYRVTDYTARDSAESSAHSGEQATENKAGDCCSKPGKKDTDASCSSDSAALVSFKSIFYGILDNKPEWIAERRILVHSIGSLLALGLLLAFLNAGVWHALPNFSTAMLPLLELAAVSVVAIVAAGYHFASYHKPISCSIGMMEGMTFGMMTGFMVGALLGASSGMFWGSVLGMLIGCVAGVWAGRPSGVMGIMEGLMAGVMSGTMGAMLSVMLLAEPLVIFLTLLIALCVIILMALVYMQIQELGTVDKAASVAPFSSMASTSLIFFVFLSFLMVYGPKSGLLFGG